jgi:hypothetical protein
MRILGVMTMALVVAASASAGEAAQAQRMERRVAVCSGMGNDFVIPRAQSIAAGMFAGIGIGIEWKSERACPPDAIRITFSYETDRALLSGALAYALPYEGTHIVVFYDRLKDPGRPNRLPGVLAHVMAHEITHILQGIHRHSESGVMKAKWTREDFNEMVFKPLPFTDTDMELIHNGLDAREARMAAAR